MIAATPQRHPRKARRKDCDSAGNAKNLDPRLWIPSCTRPWGPWAKRNVSCRGLCGGGGGVQLGCRRAALRALRGVGPLLRFPNSPPAMSVWLPVESPWGRVPGAMGALAGAYISDGRHPPDPLLKHPQDTTSGLKTAKPRHTPSNRSSEALVGVGHTSCAMSRRAPWAPAGAP